MLLNFYVIKLLQAFHIITSTNRNSQSENRRVNIKVNQIRKLNSKHVNPQVIISSIYLIDNSPELKLTKLK